MFEAATEQIVRLSEWLDAQAFDDLRRSHTSSLTPWERVHPLTWQVAFCDGRCTLGVMVIGIAAILLYWNWQLAIVTLLVVPLIGYFTYRFNRSDNRSTPSRSSVAGRRPIGALRPSRRESTRVTVTP